MYYECRNLCFYIKFEEMFFLINRDFLFHVWCYWHIKFRFKDIIGIVSLAIVFHEGFFSFSLNVNYQLKIQISKLRKFEIQKGPVIIYPLKKNYQHKINSGKIFFLFLLSNNTVIYCRTKIIATGIKYIRILPFFIFFFIKKLYLVLLTCSQIPLSYFSEIRNVVLTKLRDILFFCIPC